MAEGPEHRGGPTRCTPELIERAVGMVMAGVHTRNALVSLGVRVSCQSSWRKRAAQEIQPYARLYAALEAAEASSILHVEQGVHNIAHNRNGDAEPHVQLSAARFFLERRCREVYGPEQTVRVETGLQDMSADQLAAIVAGEEEEEEHGADG